MVKHFQGIIDDFFKLIFPYYGRAPRGYLYNQNTANDLVFNSISQSLAALT